MRLQFDNLKKQQESESLYTVKWKMTERQLQLLKNHQTILDSFCLNRHWAWLTYQYGTVDSCKYIIFQHWDMREFKVNTCLWAGKVSARVSVSVPGKVLNYSNIVMLPILPRMLCLVDMKKEVSNTSDSESILIALEFICCMPKHYASH